MIVDLVALYLNKQYKDPNGTIWTVYAVASSSPIDKVYGLLAIRSATTPSYYICPGDLDKWTLVSLPPSEGLSPQVCNPKANYFIYSLINDRRVYTGCQNSLILTFHITEFGNVSPYNGTCKYNFDLINPDPTKFIFIVPGCINSDTFEVTVQFIEEEPILNFLATVETTVTAGGGQTSGLNFILEFDQTCAGLNSPNYCIGNTAILT